MADQHTGPSTRDERYIGTGLTALSKPTGSQHNRNRIGKTHLSGHQSRIGNLLGCSRGRETRQMARLSLAHRNDP
jgi:hypothetical protein